MFRIITKNGEMFDIKADEKHETPDGVRMTFFDDDVWVASAFINNIAIVSPCSENVKKVK